MFVTPFNLKKSQKEENCESDEKFKKDFHDGLLLQFDLVRKHWLWIFISAL